MKRKYYWDIETSGLPEETLLVPEFEPAKNLRDPEKIKTDIADKRTAWLGSCALRATTGKVIAFSSAWDDDEPEFHCTPDERTMLDILDHDLREVISLGGTALAWNGQNFDVPFAVQRMCSHGIPAFKNLTVNYRGRWSWNEAFVDPMQIWTGPYQRSDGASLKAVAYALGLGLKTGNGKDFAELLKNDPIAAKEYAMNDVRLLRGVVEKMGL